MPLSLTKTTYEKTKTIQSNKNGIQKVCGKDTENGTKAKIDRKPIVKSDEVRTCSANLGGSTVTKFCLNGLPYSRCDGKKERTSSIRLA